MARIRLSRPDCGLGVQVKALKTLQVASSSLERGLNQDGILMAQVLKHLAMMLDQYKHFADPMN